MVTRSMTFSNWEAVQQWIVNEELSYNVKFVVRNSYRSGQSTVRRYWCHWNGLLQRDRELVQSHRSKSPQCTAFCIVDVTTSR